MGFSQQEYWSGLPFPSPGALPDSGIEPGSPSLQADSLPSEPLAKVKKKNNKKLGIFRPAHCSLYRLCSQERERKKQLISLFFHVTAKHPSPSFLGEAFFLSLHFHQLPARLHSHPKYSFLSADRLFLAGEPWKHGSRGRAMGEPGSGSPCLGPADLVQGCTVPAAGPHHRHPTDHMGGS